MILFPIYLVRITTTFTYAISPPPLPIHTHTLDQILYIRDQITLGSIGNRFFLKEENAQQWSCGVWVCVSMFIFMSVSVCLCVSMRVSFTIYKKTLYEGVSQMNTLNKVGNGCAYLRSWVCFEGCRVPGKAAPWCRRVRVVEYPQMTFASAGGRKSIPGLTFR